MTRQADAAAAVAAEAVAARAASSRVRRARACETPPLTCAAVEERAHPALAALLLPVLDCGVLKVLVYTAHAAWQQRNHTKGNPNWRE